MALDQAVGEFGGAGPDGDVAHAGTAGEPRERVGGVGGRTLVTDQDVPDARAAPRDAVVQGRGLAAGLAEHVRDAVAHQHLGH